MIATARRQFESMRPRADGPVPGDDLAAGGSSNADFLTGLSPTRPRTKGPSVPGYEIVREIHRGGQGVVYEAIQQTTRRTVALKVMREGPFSGVSDQLRFEREVSILAQLDHRSIVGILDRGHVGTSHFLVMDFVDGRPLDRHAREHGLDQRERLELFAHVCDAVSAAHLRGVIHRDLKPTNILVDRVGEPRVLDFGLAKQSGRDSSSADPVTQTGQFVGSLPWASPEQARGLHAEVDVRTDVYSLGIILYQLLTDRLPYSTVGDLEQVLATIRTSVPARPSGVEPKIDDDLDTITLKCLAKDPSRRYQSVGEVARDVRHYLRREPIEAKRDSGWYQLRKLLSRHRAAAAVAMVFVIVVAAAGIVALTLWRTASLERDRAVEARRRADTEAAKAKQVAQFAQGMLSGIDPVTAGSLDKQLMRLVLDGASAKVESELSGEPEAQAAVQFTIGKSYQAIGDYPKATSHLASAVETRQRVLGHHHPETLSAMDALAMLDWENGVFEEAERLSREVLSVRTNTLDADDPDRLLSMSILAEILDDQGKHEEAEALARETLERRARVLGPEHPETLSSMNNLAGILRSLRRFDEVEPLYQKTIEAEKRVKGELDPQTLRTMANLATLYLENGDLSKAETRLREVLALQQRVLGDDHPDTILCVGNIAYLLRVKGDFEQAEVMFRTAIDATRRVLGPQNPSLSNYLFSLSSLLGKKGDHDQSEKLLREAIAIDEATLPRDHWRALLRKMGLGACLTKLGRFQESEQLLLTSQSALQGRPEVPQETQLSALKQLVALYEAWDAAEPNSGKSEKAAQWRMRLEAVQPASTTQSP